MGYRGDISSLLWYYSNVTAIEKLSTGQETLIRIYMNRVLKDKQKIPSKEGGEGNFM